MTPTKSELIKDIANIEGVCEIITPENDNDNLLAVTSIIQLSYGIEIVSENSIKEIGSMVLFSARNN